MPSMPSQEEGESSYRVAGLLAFHLVSQVLDEAHIIANAAAESGRPWHYLSMRKNMPPDMTYVIPPGQEFTTPPGDFIEGNESAKMEMDNLLVTSTPQKIIDDKSKIETIIGQGDEDVDAGQSDLNNSTSMFINHLFDMSDVEHGICDNTAIIEKNIQANELLSQVVTEIKEQYNDTMLHTYDRIDQTEEEAVGLTDKSYRSTDNSSFSLLADESHEGIGKDVMFYVDDDVPTCTDMVYETPQDPMTSQRALQHYEELEEIKIENSELYENAYLTMNRDYDQCSDEDGYPILQDPKGMIMQEIELLTADTSVDTNTPCDEPEEDSSTKQRGDLQATSAVSASSRKSSLVHKCRLQGARLLACLRGWWRRKAPSKRKEGRVPGPRRGRCPMSPDARRRRASSMQGPPLSPVPSCVTWKFNTLNEALVNSSVWKDYTFETKPNDCGDL
ncbi:hypothetical protein MSG28_008067 [Choristoneura fumiferana]|uniref:Uncharacterized protein n=1 Tax=Choristoneura fumiferana TaxID=7141 RepID=A0ACC0J9Y1_CHOFU|nr:hypothetical protein MSG28_008067 [Choristoneura fumiferana]